MNKTTFLFLVATVGLQGCSQTFRSEEDLGNGTKAFVSVTTDKDEITRERRQKEIEDKIFRLELWAKEEASWNDWQLDKCYRNLNGFESACSRIQMLDHKPCPKTLAEIGPGALKASCSEGGTYVMTGDGQHFTVIRQGNHHAQTPPGFPRVTDRHRLETGRGPVPERITPTPVPTETPAVEAEYELAKKRHEQRKASYDECQKNMETIVAGMNAYSKAKKKGKGNLTNIVPKFLAKIPQCPTGGHYQLLGLDGQTDELRCDGAHFRSRAPVWNSQKGFTGGFEP